MTFNSYKKGCNLTGMSCIDEYYYTPKRIKEICIEKGTFNSSHDLRYAFCNTQSEEILIVDEKGYKHKMVAFNYVRGNKLSVENAVDKTTYVKNEFKEIHGDKYDYSLVDYKVSTSQTKIICKKHGVFLQTPKAHKKGSGCNKCSRELRGKVNAVKLRKLPKELVELASRVRGVIGVYYRKNRTKKIKKTHQILGCTWKEFKNHLEDNSYGFKISKKGLDLDHIVPISTAKNKEDLFKLNSYKNFQLLPSYYNRHIKADKKWHKEHFEKWLKDNPNMDENLKSRES